ncbi:MAG: M20/M25/M40 family metallo-hydrolase [bacterium]|nr:M20/M25/M40 family metallo-hydrolase [bacterium]
MTTPTVSVLSLTQELVGHPSVTSESNEAALIPYQHHLKNLGFEVRVFPYRDQQGQAKVALEAKRSPVRPSSSCGVGYFCHNDVVSIDGWNCPHGGPFDARIADGRLWGRGSCDMKGSAAAALAAIARIPQSEQSAAIYFFVTGDEECGMIGADLLAERSEFFLEMVEKQSVGIIGEPTELKLVNSHKGGCHLDVISTGVAAHSSTSDGRNANLQMIPFLSFLHDLYARSQTDSALQNSDFDPPQLSLNFVLENHPQSANITVGKSVCRIFFRPMPNTPWQSIFEDLQSEARRLGLQVVPLRPLPPVHTPADRVCVQETLKLLDQAEPLTVCYATDGCCLQTLRDLIILGPGSIEQAHRPNEFITLEQLEMGVQVFERVFRKFAAI